MNKKQKLENIQISIADNIENLQLPDPSLVMFYQNLEQRVIWMDSEVDGVFLDYGKYIIQWNMEDSGIPVEKRKPIRLMFFSPGGYLDINNALIDIITNSDTPVYGYNMGIAESAGCFIFLSCHKRFAMPKSTFLLHKGSSRFEGNYNEIMCQMLEYQRKIAELEAYVRERTNMDEETIAENIDTEWFITAEEALEYGIIDEIMNGFSILYE